MAIAPISNVTLSRYNNNINFGHKVKNNHDEPTESSASNLKKVPVLVLLAMSPLNTSNTIASSPELYTIPITEVQQKEKTSEKSRSPVQIATWRAEVGNEKILYVMFDCKGKTNNAELVGFEYKNKLPKNKYGILRGFVTAFSDQLVDKGIYLMAYQEVDENTGEVARARVCKVPADFKDRLTLFKIAYSGASIANEAIKYLPPSEFKRALNIKNFDRIPLIEQEYDILQLSNGQEVKVSKPSSKSY